MAGKDFTVYVNIGGREAPSLPATIKTVEGKLSGLTRHFQAQAAAQKAAIAGMMGSLKGVAAMAAGVGLAASLKHMIGDGEALAHEIQGLRNAGRTAHEIADGIAAATKSIQEMPTASLETNIKLLNETTGAFGDYHHAVENLQFNSKLADVLKNTIGVDDPAHAIGSLIKTLEIRGSASDPAKYRREAGELQKAMTFFGGRLTPDMLYTFATNAQTGIRQLNERFLTKIAPSLIQEIGGDKVGTGLTAFRTIISGRKITDKKQAEAWQQLGLLNKSGIIKNKQGDVTGWKEGSVMGTKLAYQDPLEYMEKIILPRLQSKQHVDITDPIKLGAALNTLFKNTKANAFVTAIATVVDRTRLKKDEGLIQKVLDTDKNYDESLLNDPKLARFAIVQAVKNLGAAFSLPMMKPIAQTLISIARSVNALAAALMSHPGAAKVLAQIGFALAGWAALRLASFALGLTGLARAIVYLGAASTVGVAARLVAISRAFVALSLAATVGLARRLSLTAGALLMLGRVGGASAILGAVGGSLAALGASLLRFPIVALRAVGMAMWGLVANPVGIAITAIVTALAALGIWVANNWAGIKTFFSAFGESFMKGLGPQAGGAVQSLASGIKAVWDWVSKLLGPIDEVGTKWKAWGESAGTVAAKIVNGLANLPSEMKRLGKEALSSITDIDWAAAGSAIVSGIVSGITGGAAAIGGAVKGAVDGVRGWVKGTLGIGAPAATSPAHRAMGGPVTGGMPYLVGERGPEIFVPAGHGAIRTNGFLNRLGGMGGPTVDASAIGKTATAAREAGGVLHAALDATRKPIVDTTSLDEATAKASNLQSILGAIGSSSINLGGIGGIGGGGGGGGGGSWNGKTMPVGNGAGIGHTASQAERAAFTQEYAKSIGIDPKTALRVSQSEGFYKYTGDHGRSFGDWQLFTGGGIGNRALKAGISVRDPHTWREQTKFALNIAKREGWSQWHGARRVGIGNWQGLGRRAMGGPVDAGSPYIVGERGPELFTPGASGAISTNADLRVLRRGDGSSVPDAEAVAKNRPGKTVSNVRGDTRVTNHWTINGADKPHEVQRQVEARFSEMLRQMESEQRGLLSD